MKTIPINSLRIDGGTQTRAQLNESVVAEYAEVIRFGGSLPPVTVYFDGSENWLADGFHRYHAHRAAGAMEIEADVRNGTKRDAILHSVGANAVHGLRRTNEDKRRAVTTLLGDKEWAAWTDREIAKACGVSHPFVAAIRNPEVAVKQQANRDLSAVARFNKVESDSTLPEVGSDSTTTFATPLKPCAPATPSAEPAVTPAAPAPISAQETKVTEQISELTEMLETLQANLKDTLADNEMMGRVFDADDRLKAAMDEAKRQKAIAENAERTLASKSGEFIERARAVTYWKNRAEKAEKKLATLEKAA